MSDKALILSAVRAHPGIGVAELAGRLGMQKPNARRDALQLRDKGLLTARECEAGYSFFPAGGAPPVQENAVDHHRPQAAVLDLEPVRQAGGQVIHTLRDARSKRPRAAPREGDFDDGLLGDADDPGDWPSPPTAPAPVIPRPPSKTVTVAPPRPPEPSLGELAMMAVQVGLGGLLAWNNLAQNQAEAQVRTPRRSSTPVEPMTDHFVERRRAQEAEERAAPVRPRSIKELLTRSKTRTIPDSGARPSASGWSWLRARFATPSKPVFK